MNTAADGFSDYRPLGLKTKCPVEQISGLCHELVVMMKMMMKMMMTMVMIMTAMMTCLHVQ